MRLIACLRRSWARLRGLLVPEPTPTPVPDKLAGIPVFHLPAPGHYIELLWDSDSDVSPHTPRRRHVVGGIQKKCQPSDDSGDDEDG